MIALIEDESMSQKNKLLCFSKAGAANAILATRTNVHLEWLSNLGVITRLDTPEGPRCYKPVALAARA